MLDVRTRTLCAAALLGLAVSFPAPAAAEPPRPASDGAVPTPEGPGAGSAADGAIPAPVAGPAGASTEPAPSTDLALSPSTSRREMPWASLGGDDYRLVREVIDRAAVSGEVKDISFRSRKPVFDFLIEHLDFASDVARALRQGKYRVRRAGDAYEAEDGHGARGTLRTVVADGDRHVFYLAGRYDAPLLPALEIRGVLQLDAEHVEGPDGITYCELQMAGHVRFDSRVAETLAAVARGYSGAQLGRQLQRFFRHIAVVSRRAYDDPEGLADELARRPELSPQRVAEFRQVLVGHLPPPWAQTQQYRLIEPLTSPAPQE